MHLPPGATVQRPTLAQLVYRPEAAERSPAQVEDTFRKLTYNATIRRLWYSP